MSFDLSEEEVELLARKIFQDYQLAADDPFKKETKREKTLFDAVGLPEKPVIEQISKHKLFNERDLVNYLTLTVVVNYNKETSGPAGIWATTWGLLKYNSWLFRPEEVVEREREAVRTIFKNEPIMNLDDPDIYYDDPDVTIWAKNAESLAEDYNSDARELLKSYEYDAVQLQKEIDKTKKFPFLGGNKINPLWLRLMHEEIHELERIDEISIPVDRHIRTITRQLQQNRSSNDEEIRAYWDRICDDTELIPVRLDQPLWILGKYWNSIGKSYVENKVEEISFFL